MNEANQIYSTQELVTFVDVLYPQIEQISKVLNFSFNIDVWVLKVNFILFKKYNCDFVMFDNEDIIITNGLNNATNRHHLNYTMQSILCALEICKFIE